MQFVIKRFALSIPTLLILFFIVFLLLDLAPGDAADALITEEMSPTAEAIIRAELGLDRPLVVRYFDYLFQVVRGDLGVSLRSQVPVADEIALRLPNTLFLAVGALFTSLVIGALFGGLAAQYHNRIPDHFLTLFISVSQALPLFWIALMMVLVFSVQLGWFPVFGIGTPLHWVLPIFTTSLALAPGTARLVRTSLLEAQGAPHIIVARAKGLARSQVFWRHIVPFVAIPVVSYLGLQAAFLVSGLIFIEIVFGIPGLGTLALQSVQDQDPLLLQGVTFVIAILTLTVLTLTDLVVLLLDPRIRS